MKAQPHPAYRDMIKIKISRSRRREDSYWDPGNRELHLLGAEDPMGAAHEIAHARLEHGISGSIIADMVQENDAWILALSRIHPSEIRLSQLHIALDSYLSAVEEEYGTDSPQHKLALGVYHQVMGYAKQKVRAAKPARIEKRGKTRQVALRGIR